MVLGAYARGTHGGSILDLLEPGHAGLPGMPMLDNSRFPEDWYERTSACEHRCRECGYCKAVFEKVAVAMPDMPALAYPEASGGLRGIVHELRSGGHLLFRFASTVAQLGLQPSSEDLAARLPSQTALPMAAEIGSGNLARDGVQWAHHVSTLHEEVSICVCP